MSRRKRRLKGDLAPALIAGWALFIIGNVLAMTGPHIWHGLILDLPSLVQAPRAVSAATLIGKYVLDFIFLIAFAVSALGFGMPVVRFVFRVPLSGIERFLLAQGFGLGLLALLTLAAGTMIGVNPGLAFALVGAGMGLTAVELIRWFKNRPSGSPERPTFFADLTPFERVLCVLLAAALFFHLVGALGPETFYDSLVYHLGAPNLYRLRGRIGPIDGLLHANFPQNMEMLYLLAMLLRGFALAKLLQFWMLLLTLGGIYGLGRSACSRKTALTACLLFATVPAAAFAVWHTSVEIGLTFWSLIGVWTLIRGFYSTEPLREEVPPPYAVGRRPNENGGGTSPAPWLIASGIFHGLALGVKYTAVWNAAAAAAVLAVWLLRNRTFSRRRAAGFFGYWIIAASLTFLPWVLKNISFTGNPVYPFLPGIFGPGGGAPDIAGLQETARGHFWYGGLGNWRTWILTPWRLFREGRSHYSFIGPLLIAFFPLIFRLRRAIFPFGWILALFLLQYAAWSASSSMIRFFIPALPLFCLYTAHQLTALGREWRPWVPWLLLPLVIWDLGWMGSMLNEKRVPSVVIGIESLAGYLSRPHIGYPNQQYPIARYINKTLPLNARLLLLGEARTAFLKRDAIASTAFDKNLLIELLGRTEDVKSLRRALTEEYGITHILADYPESLRLLREQLQSLDRNQLLILSRFWRGCLRELQRTDMDVSLYAITPLKNPIPRARTPRDLPAIVRMAVEGHKEYERLGPADQARFLKSLAN